MEETFTEGTERIDKLQLLCKELGTTVALHVQTWTHGNETEYQLCLLQVVQQIQNHLGLSLSARSVNELLQSWTLGEGAKRQ